MIKKGIAIFFVLFANLLLLAHAFIPHHHHDGEICIFNTYCQTDQHKNDFDNSEHKQNKSDYECCVLATAVVAPSGILRQYCKSSDTNNDCSHFSNYNVYLLNIKNPSFSKLFDANSVFPAIFSYTQIINNLLGLRAPPVV